MEDFPLRELPSKDTGWSENYCLAGYDPASGIDLFLHIGRWRKDLTLWREIVAIALPDGRVVAHRAVGKSLASAEGPGGSLLAVRVIKDQKRLSWRFEGGARLVDGAQMRRGLIADGPLEHVRFDLEFDGVAPVWDISKVGHTTEFMGRGHTEQLGRVTGPIQVGEMRYDFDGVLNRDHSRGVRVFGQNLRHIWMHGRFTNGVGFQLYEAELIEGTAAFSEVNVLDGGRHYEAKIELGFRIPLADGLQHRDRPTPFTLVYEKGRLEIVAERFPTTIYGCGTTPNDLYLGMNGVETQGAAGFVEQSAEYVLNGETRGFGHMERLIPGRWVEEP